MPRVQRHAESNGNGGAAATVAARVCELLVEHLGVEAGDCTLDAHLVDDLGADSLDVVELEMHLEDAFHIEREVMDEAVAELLDKGGTVKDLVALVEQHRRRV